MDDWSELWLFALFLGTALWYALAGGAIMGLLDFASRYFLKGEDPRKLYPWALGASFVLGMFMQWQGMHRELEQLKNPQPVAQDEGSRKIIADLRQQLIGKELEFGELKRLKDRAEDATGRAVSENAALNNKLRDLQGKLADKIARQTHMEKLAAFLDTGEAIKRKCFSGLATPRKEAVEWHDQILSYLKMTMDSSHVIRFKNTRSPKTKLHYFLPGGNPVAKECNDNAQDIDIKLDVLRDFLSELSR